MTREELQAVVEVCLGLRSSHVKVDTVMRAADAYAATVAEAYAATVAERQRELYEATS